MNNDSKHYNFKKCVWGFMLGAGLVSCSDTKKVVEK